MSLANAQQRHAAATLGRAGGRARARALTVERRREIAAQGGRAAQARRAAGRVADSLPLQALKHHVTGAIERGEKEAIVGQPANPQAS